MKDVIEVILWSIFGVIVVIGVFLIAKEWSILWNL